MLRITKKHLFLLLGLISFQSHAQQIVVAPQCLLKQIHSNYKTLAATTTFSLIATDNIKPFIAAKNNHKILCGGFMDVTQSWNENKSTPQKFLKPYTETIAPTHTKNYDIRYQTQVEQLLKQINPQNMLDNLTTLTNFKDRYANSQTGVKAAEWIKSQVEKIAADNHREDVNVYTIATGTKYSQPSVIVKIGDTSEPGIVIGAHLDTLDGSYSKKPGADDDGSGSVTVLETARTILSSGMTFKKPLYFIWYAAEEEGLVGSGYVVSEFKKQHIAIDAVLHFDLTGYAFHNESTMWLIDDYVNKDLVIFLGKLISAYVKQPIQHTRCGYACSDHATWTQNGYAAAIPAEAAYENTNPNIHSSRDSMEKLSLAHMTDYLKLATAFAVEMAAPTA